jgi:hypothetical protein
MIIFKNEVKCNKNLLPRVNLELLTFLSLLIFKFLEFSETRKLGDRVFYWAVFIRTKSRERNNSRVDS